MRIWVGVLCGVVLVQVVTSASGAMSCGAGAVGGHPYILVVAGYRPYSNFRIKRHSEIG